MSRPFWWPADANPSEDERFRPWPADPRYLVGDLGTIRGQQDQVVDGYVNACRGGYRVVYVPALRRQLEVHILVCETWHGPRPTSEHQAAHGNGIPADNRAANLRWATPLENMDDARRHGTLPIGERNGSAKLTEDDVRRIRALAAAGERSPAIAARFCVTDSMVRHIVNGRSWRHIQDRPAGDDPCLHGMTCDSSGRDHGLLTRNGYSQ